MSKIASLAADPFLVDYAAGALVRFTKPIQPILAPTVEVGTVIGHYKNYERDSRLTLPHTRRELNGRAVRLEIGAIDAGFACSINAIDMPLDKSLGEVDLKWAIPDALDLLGEIESQVLEYETITAAIAAAGAGSDIDFAAANDPVKLIDAQLLTLAKQSRSDSLGVAFGSQAWHLFKNHPKVVARAGASIAWESHPNLFHAGARYAACYSLYDTAPEGVTEDIDFMFPETAILLVSRSERPTRRSPDFMKTFRTRNKAQGFKLVESADGRIINVQNDWATDLKVTNEAGVLRFNVIES